MKSNTNEFELAPKRILRIADKRSLSNIQLARKMDISTQAITNFSKAKDCSVLRLKDYCQVLDYNFFQEIANEIPQQEPRPGNYPNLLKELEESKKELANMRDEMRLKDREIEVLNRALSLVSKG